MQDFGIIVQHAGPIGIILFILFMVYKEWIHRKDRNVAETVKDLDDRFSKYGDESFAKMNSLHNTIRMGSDVQKEVLAITAKIAETQAVQAEILRQMHIDVSTVKERTSKL